MSIMTILMYLVSALIAIPSLIIMAYTLFYLVKFAIKILEDEI